jgi:prepilin peptidase CpaA
VWLDVLLVTVLLICLYTDVRSRKIYNICIFPSLLVAIVLHFASNGIYGISTLLIGFSAGLGLLIIPYFLGGIGAGDVKLLAVIGAIKGAEFVLLTGIYMALVGGVIALIILFVRPESLKLIKWVIISLSIRKTGCKMPLILNKDGLKTTYPYGVAIAAGAFIVLFVDGAMLL